MAQIRSDFEGTVFTSAGPLVAGDDIPDGVHVGGHLTEDGKPVNAPTAPVQAAPAEVEVDALDEDDTASAEALGIPTDGVHPERVRGALVGYAQGWEDAVTELAKERAPETNEGLGAIDTFDPGEHTATEVHEYLKEHPARIPAVLALELAREKPRAGIVDKYQA